MATTLSNIIAGLGTTRQAVANSLQWFRGVASSLRRNQHQPPQPRNERSPFQLIALRYSDPVTPAYRMSYYDRLPLIVLLGERNANGKMITTGLNTHYLNPRTRTAFFNILRTAQTSNSQNFRARALQQLINLSKHQNPSVIRNYRNDHIGMFRRIPVSETMNAAALFAPMFQRNSRGL
jgi:hypothetical protein